MKLRPIFVIGKRDMEGDAVSVRIHGKGNLGAKPRAEILSEILQSIKARRP
jgi:threonyl-tRNA synthetase